MESITPIELGRNREPISAKVKPQTEIKMAIKELRAGRMIIVVDDENRENEGDLLMAAEKVTPGAINFMATHARGLICLAITGDRLHELDLGPMCPRNTATTLTP